MTRLFRCLLVVLFLTGALAVSGCATVKPWQRSTLMRRVMRSAFDGGESAFEGHVHTTREGMAGAAASRGASCGCN